MTARCTLAFVSGMHVVTTTLALRYAVERGLAVDAAGVHRAPENVPRDAYFLGTGVTPPLVFTGVQAIAATVVLCRPSSVAARTLGILGAVMLVGYAVERETRRALRPGHWDSRVTPLTAAGAALAVPMAVLGLRAPFVHGGDDPAE
jgi:ABC-type phosphate transport system permease subunit